MKNLGIMQKANAKVLAYMSKPYQNDQTLAKQTLLKQIATVCELFDIIAPGIICSRVLQELQIARIGWDNVTLKKEITLNQQLVNSHQFKSQGIYRLRNNQSIKHCTCLLTPQAKHTEHVSANDVFTTKSNCPVKG